MTVRMVDVGSKENVARRATARGRIELRPQTLERIRRGEIEKGDVIGAAQIAGIQAAKRTQDLIPLCHPIPITFVGVEIEVQDDCVQSECTVSASHSTGVEMEALTGATISLLTVWDMVKYLEKDAGGQYPETSVTDIRVISKRKG